MKFILRLENGTWVGGFECTRDTLAVQLMDLRPLATLWKQTVVATRVDRRGRQTEPEVYMITPVPGLDLGMESEGHDS